MKVFNNFFSEGSNNKILFIKQGYDSNPEELYPQGESLSKEDMEKILGMSIAELLENINNYYAIGVLSTDGTAKTYITGNSYLSTSNDEDMFIEGAISNPEFSTFNLTIQLNSITGEYISGSFVLVE